MVRIPCRLLRAALLLSILPAWHPSLVVAQPSAAGVASCDVNTLVGVRRYRSGVWGLAELRALNPTDSFAEVQAVLRFVDEPTVQFSRRAMVPPLSLLRTTLPFRIPDTLPAGKRSVDLLTEQVLPLERAEPEKTLTPSEVMMAGKQVPLDSEIPAVGMIVDADRLRPDPKEQSFHTGVPLHSYEPDQLFYEMVLAAKRARRLSRRVSSIVAEDLLPDPACLDVLDVLVLCTDRFAADAAVIVVVRDWVLSGGHLWITLDDVGPESVSALMGDAFACALVDRVELTRLRVDMVGRGAQEEPLEEIELEEPVRFVRVMAEGVTTLMTVEGWPAAFWQPFGEGRIYFTTLGPAAWMRPTAPDDPPPLSDQDATAFCARPALAELADLCLAPSRKPRPGNEAFQPFLFQQIGYRIPGRTTVATILAVHCVLLVVLALACFRRRRAEYLLWWVPAISGVTGLVFLICGLASTRAVPPTVATLSRVVLEPGVATAHSRGLIAMYNQEACSEPVGAARGGVFFPDMAALGGRQRRMTWTDEGAWSWDSLELPAGVRTAAFEQPWELNAAPDCRVQFGPDGLRGRVGPLPLSMMSDALIAVPHQHVMSASLGDDGSIRSRLEDVLPAGEYVAGALLNDERLRRNTVYQSLLDTEPEEPAFPRAVLLAWAEPREVGEMGFVFPQPQRYESILFSIPLRLQRSPPGTEVAIPAPFVSYRAVPEPGGGQPTAYANRMRAWIETKLPASDWLRFQIPRAVLPLQVHRARLAIRVRAPSRPVEILAVDRKELVTIARLSRPIGSYQYTIDRPELLQLDADGGLYLVVRVGEDEAAEAPGATTRLPWRMEKLQLEITGTVQGE